MLGQLTIPKIDAAIASGIEYLKRHIGTDGRFDYEVDIRTGKSSSKYNLLRHAGTTMVLFRFVDSRFDDGSLRALAEATWSYLAKFLVPVRWHEHYCVCLADDNIAKLGGTALALLALAEDLQKPRIDAERTNLVRALATYLISQQFPDGSFESKLDLLSGETFSFRSAYYPGQAVLALCNAFERTGHELYLERARTGISSLIDKHIAEPPTALGPVDHWSMIALGRLFQVTSDLAYVDHLRFLARPLLKVGHTDTPEWIENDNTTQVSTRLEGLVSLLEIEVKVGERRNALQLLRVLSLGLEHCYLRQVGSFELTDAGAIGRSHGGFVRSLEIQRVRIDYVQHALAASFGVLHLLPMLDDVAHTATDEDSKWSDEERS